MSYDEQRISDQIDGGLIGKSRHELLTDDQINAAWGHANFGESSHADSEGAIARLAMITRRDIVASTLLKYACGYHSGSTARAICVELGLASRTKSNGIKLTGKGKEYLYAHYRKPEK